MKKVLHPSSSTFFEFSSSLFLEYDCKSLIHPIITNSHVAAISQVSVKT